MKEEIVEKKETKKEIKENKERNIFEKMSLITNEISTVGKKLKVQVNKNASYNAVSERDILDAVKPIEFKYGVYSYPVDRKIIENDVLVKETEYNGQKTTSNSLYMRVETIYRFVNIEKPEEFIDIKTYGDGIDTGDKAPGKATTYADKYALMKAYKISTGDDPDKDASPEKGYEKIKKEPNYRQELINFCKKNNIDMNEIAKQYNLVGKKMSNDDYYDVLCDLMGVK